MPELTSRHISARLQRLGQGRSGRVFKLSSSSSTRIHIVWPRAGAFGLLCFGMTTMTLMLMETSWGEASCLLWLDLRLIMVAALGNLQQVSWRYAFGQTQGYL